MLSEYDYLEPYPVSFVEIQSQEVPCQSLEVTVIDYCETDLQCNPYTQVCRNDEAVCAFPCPSTLFTSEEYNSQVSVHF
jgi:hypothetical protein